jgi:hypothetical protein
MLLETRRSPVLFHGSRDGRVCRRRLAGAAGMRGQNARGTHCAKFPGALASALGAVWLFAAGAFGNAAPAAEPPCPYYAIRVVDDRTGRGVPLVELKTVNEISYWTDSNGLVAFHEPGLMDRQVFFYASSHGYEMPKDGFGFAGKSLHTSPGGSAELRIRRINIAERLYRVTGGGIYRDSVLAGRRAPLREPLLNAEVFGQDSVMAVPFAGKIHWFWGDTNRPKYPLGLFQTSGATSELPGQGGLDPAVGVDLEYFRAADGFSKAMCPTTAPGPVWVEGLLALPDDFGRRRLVARYMRMKSLGEMLEHGLIVFDESDKVFRKEKELDLNSAWRCPRGHPVGHVDGGVEYFLFPTPYATVRVRARWRDLMDPARYEAFTCAKPGAAWQNGKTQLDRDAAGKLVYAWKPNADPIDSRRERELLAAGKIRPDEAFFQPRDVDGGKTIELHGGSIAWNAHRRKWIMIALQQFGTSMLGEVWFLEADAPTGPWLRAKKVATHDKYSFYNPVHHPFFDQAGGRFIYFEGTYASTFSGNLHPTPRYNYNQIMYRLDLADPRLASPLEKTPVEKPKP